VISGPSGVGKSSVVDGITRAIPVHFSVSATTRTARPGEQDGIDYHFVTRVGFTRMVEAGHLLEWAEYGGHLYGTPAAPVLERLAAGDDVVLDIESQGAAQVQAAYPDAVSIFLAPPSRAELERRLRSRGDTAEPEVQRRLALAVRQMEEAPARYDHLVVNDDLERAIAEVVRILSVSEETDTHDD
jgi:guanylate kinase